MSVGRSKGREYWGSQVEMLRCGSSDSPRPCSVLAKKEGEVEMRGAVGSEETSWGDEHKEDMALVYEAIC